MLTLRVLEKDSTINNFTPKTDAKVIGGETATIRLQLWQPDKSIRYIVAAGGTIAMTLKTSDPTVTITATCTFPFTATDRSIFEFALTGPNCTALISQNLVATVTEGSVVTVAILQIGLQKVRLAGEDC